MEAVSGIDLSILSKRRYMSSEAKKPLGSKSAPEAGRPQYFSKEWAGAMPIYL